ncbi:MAG: hypothetical protein QXT86_13595 [Archaeoglobaceae archaeon]
MGIEKCFHNLVKDDSFVKEFKAYVKNMYASGKVYREYQFVNFPGSWQNANRQINRIIAFARGTGSQSRSGKKALSEGGWLNIALNKFIEEVFDLVAIGCLKERGYEGDKPVGYFAGFIVEEEAEKLGRQNFRGTFDDWESLKNYSGQFISSAPVGLAIACGRHVYVMPSL